MNVQERPDVDQELRPNACIDIVEARKLEHQYPHALKVEYRGS